MTDEQILAEYRDDSKFPYISEAIYTLDDVVLMLSAARQDERERVEGEFAEWADGHNYRMDLKGLWYNALGGSEDYQKYTTPELYQLFLQSKNKTP